MRRTEEKMLKKIQQEYDKRAKIEQIGKRDQEPNLLNISKALDEYYIFTKLKNHCMYLSYCKIVSEEKMPYKASDFRFISAILAELEIRSFENPIIDIYNKIRLLYDTSNSLITLDDFENLLAQISILTPKLNVDEGIEIYSLLTGYCIRKANQGEKDYSIQLFMIYNEMINLQYGRNARKSKKLPPGMFKNMVVMAIILKDDALFNNLETAHISINPKLKGNKRTFAWIEEFIAFYKKKIDRKEAPNYVKFCEGLFKFEQKKYIQAYNVLNKPLHTHGLFINMDIKILYLKVLYEIETTQPGRLKKDEIDLVLDAYRSLLRDSKRRKKDVSYQIYFYRTFQKTYKQLHDTYCNSHNQEMKDKLGQAISALPSYSFKTWFLQKYQIIIEKE